MISFGRHDLRCRRGPHRTWSLSFYAARPDGIFSATTIATTTAATTTSIKAAECGGGDSIFIVGFLLLSGL
jgi:hypothetical protein